MSEIYKAPEAELQEKVEVGQFGSLEAALEGRYDFKPVELIKEAWRSLKGFMGVYWLALIIYMVIAGIVSAISGLVVTPAAELIPTIETITPWQIVGQVASQLFSMFITLPLTAGLFMITLKHSVRAPIRAEQVVKYYDKAVPLFLTTLIMYALIILGLVLFILPGIYLMVTLSMAIPLVVEKNMTPWQALMTSRKALSHRCFSLLGLLLLTVLVLLLGALALFVGLIWALPVTALAYGLAYRNIFGVEAETLIEN